MTRPGLGARAEWKLNGQESEKIISHVLKPNLNHIWKSSQGIFFSMYHISLYIPFWQLMATNGNFWSTVFFRLSCRIGKTMIYLVKNIIIIDLQILGMDFFQHSGHNMMPISSTASYVDFRAYSRKLLPFLTHQSCTHSKCWFIAQFKQV